MDYNIPKTITRKDETYVNVDQLKATLDQIELRLNDLTKYKLYQCGLSEFKTKILQVL
jgi:hypothetical protein